MRLSVTGRNLEITPALRQLVERKLSKFDRLLHDGIVSGHVVLTLEKYRRISEITLHARGDHILHGLADASSWQNSMTLAAEKVRQQAERLKGKWTRRKQRATVEKGLAPAGATAVAAEQGAPARRIVRALRSAVKPMTVEDAALRVDTGSDTFIVFRNATTDAINILYRRKDGNLGLIEPEP